MTEQQFREQGRKLKRRYERSYYSLFYKALRAQKLPVVTAAKNDIGAAFAQVSLITTKPLDDAYKNMYYKVVPHEASREYKRLQVQKSDVTIVNQQGTPSYIMGGIVKTSGMVVLGNPGVPEIIVPLDKLKAMLRPNEQKSFGVNIDWLSDIANFLDQYLLDKIVLPMTGRTMERMYRVLNNGIATGQSNDEIIRNLQDTEVDKQRARLIARTEATRATNFATKLGGDKHDFKINRLWIAAEDRRTRGGPGKIHIDDKADHYHMNGMEAADNNPFTDPRSGAQMMYPGDSMLGAGAEDVCNCRCSCGQVPVRDADGNLVLK